MDSLAPPAGAAKPSAGLAAELRARDAMERALRAEVHRLREEGAALRRAAGRAAHAESELQVIKATSEAGGGNPKAPLRLQRLELENARLRQDNARLAERCRGLESDEHRQRVLDHHSFMLRGTARPDDAAPPGQARPPLPGPSSPTDRPATAAAAAAAAAADRSVLVVRGQAPSAAGRFQIQIHERAAAADRAALQAELRATAAQLEEATAELDGVRRWVASVVAAHRQYPALATAVPTTQLADSSRLLWSRETGSPSAMLGQLSRLPTGIL